MHWNQIGFRDKPGIMEQVHRLDHSKNIDEI